MKNVFFSASSKPLLLSTLRYENWTLFYHEQSIYLDVDRIACSRQQRERERERKRKRGKMR